MNLCRIRRDCWGVLGGMPVAQLSPPMRRLWHWPACRLLMCIYFVMGAWIVEVSLRRSTTRRSRALAPCHGSRKDAASVP